MNGPKPDTLMAYGRPLDRRQGSSLELKVHVIAQVRWKQTAGCWRAAGSAERTGCRTLALSLLPYCLLPTPCLPIWLRTLATSCSPASGAKTAGAP